MARSVKEITNEHRNVAYLKTLRKTNKEIAEETGFSESHVKNILRNPEIQELVKSETLTNEVTGMEKGVGEVISRATLKAVVLLERIIDDSPTLGHQAATLKQRMEAALEVIKIAGLSTNNSNVVHTHILKPSDMEDIRSRAVMYKPQEVIDVEVSDD